MRQSSELVLVSESLGRFSLCTYKKVTNTDAALAYIAPGWLCKITVPYKLHFSTALHHARKFKVV